MSCGNTIRNHTRKSYRQPQAVNKFASYTFFQYFGQSRDMPLYKITWNAYFSNTNEMNLCPCFRLFLPGNKNSIMN